MQLTIKNLWARAKIWLHIVLPAAGLEITDHAIRWCRLGDGAPKIFTLNVPPGVLQEGKIIDRPAFAALLAQVRVAVSGPRPAAKKDLVVLTLGSAPTFMRLFYLPLIERDRLEKAVVLNLQMISPSGGPATNSGWQILSEDAEKNRFEVVGVFIDHLLMDAMVEVLREAGFMVVAAESKVLSLARALAKGGGSLDPQAAYVMISCDDAGMDFMIVRKGVLCFAYTIPWHEIENEQGQVEDERFAGALTRGVRQIVNFYGQHWSDPITAAVIVANDLMPTVQAVVAANVSYAVVPFMAGGSEDTREIPVAFGAALRGISPHEEDRDVTLLGSDASEIYQEEKVIFFLRFWRVVFPVILGVVVAAAMTGDILWFGKSESAATSGVPAVSAGVESQLAALTPLVRDFNQTVLVVQNIETSLQPKSAVIARFEAVAATSSVALTHIAVGAQGSPVTLSGIASSEEAIVGFKNTLVSSTLVRAVTLPFSGIQPAGSGFSFTMTANQ